MLFRFNPSGNELARCQSTGFASVADLRWYAWLNLVWSSFILTTPWFAGDAFPHALWPTLISFAIFLWLYFRAFYRSEGENVLWYAIAIAALGFLVTPFNSGAQGYLIYACAFFAFATTLRGAVRLMAGMLALYALEWRLLGFPWIYISSVMIVGPVVGGMNLVYRRNQQRNAELKLTHDEVRRLAALAERERIGRDLHDLLGHTLSLIALKSELARKLFVRDPAAARREIDDVERIARDALAQVRHAVSGIRAAALAGELASARLLLECAGVRFGYVGFESESELPAARENCLALALREAVTNIQRHADATQAEARFAVDGDMLQLTVQDNGRGGIGMHGHGLDGMRERVAAQGGSLRIDSPRGQGTTLIVRLPLPFDATTAAASEPRGTGQPVAAMQAQA
jgi:two-component system sensor histidine kinase DesK